MKHATPHPTRETRRKDHPIRHEPPVRKRTAEVMGDSRSGLSGLELSLVVPLVTLGETLEEKEVIAFRDQARARPALLTQIIVKGKARTLIEYRLIGDSSQTFVPLAQIEDW